MSPVTVRASSDGRPIDRIAARPARRPDQAAHVGPPDRPVEDPYAWLRDREDPDTIAYLEAENAYAGGLLRPARRPRRGAVRGDQVARPGDRRVGARAATARGGTSPAPSRASRTRCSAAAASIDDAVRRHPRLQRRGRGPRLLRRPRRRPVARPLAAGLVERRRRRRALHAAGPRPGHRRRPPRRADRAPRRGAAWPGRRRAVAVLRPTRRADAAVPDLAPPPRHARRRRSCSSSRSPTSASTSTSRRRAASSGSSSPAPAGRHPRCA